MLFQDKLWQLVNDLSKGTKANAIKWNETADEDTFRTILEKGMVCIERHAAPLFDASEEAGRSTGDPLDNPQKRVPIDNFVYWLVLFDDKNDEIARYTPESETKALTLRNLWEFVRASARNTEQKIDSLLQELARKNAAFAPPPNPQVLSRS